MRSIALTETAIKRLSTKEERIEIRDKLSRGLYVRVSRTGTKVWRFRYKFEDKRYTINIGAWPSINLSKARGIVQSYRDDLQQGINPKHRIDAITDEMKAIPTVSDFSQIYIERYAKANKRSWQEDLRMLQKDILPVIGAIPITDVKRQHLISVVDRIHDRGAFVQANRVASCISRLFSFAMERGVIDLSPAQNLPKRKEYSREVVLDDDALCKLWCETSLPVMRLPTRMALRMLILTGARNAEVCGLHTSEIKADVWHLPAERSKNKRGHTVYLSEPAMDIIHTMWPESGEGFIFPSNGASGHVTRAGPSRAMLRIFDGAYRPHDLRRTVGTRLSMLGFNRMIQDKTLNHVDSSVGGIYDRYSYENEKREALTTWASELMRIVGESKPLTEIA